MPSTAEPRLPRRTEQARSASRRRKAPENRRVTAVRHQLSCTQRRYGHTRTPRQSFSKAEVPTCGCSCVNVERNLLGRIRSLIGNTSCLRGLRRSARDFNEQTAAALDELQSLGRMKPSRSTTRRNHVASKVLLPTSGRRCPRHVDPNQQKRPSVASRPQQRAVVQRERD